MNKPFDLLAAQRGALIQQSHYLPSDDNDKWFDVRFVGVMSDGDIVLERTPNHVVTAKRKFLRMKPVKRMVWVVLEDCGTRFDPRMYECEQTGAKCYPIVIEE